MKVLKGKLKISLLAALLVFLSPGLLPAETTYKLDLKIDYDQFYLLGNEEISFTNESAAKIGSMQLMLYPNFHAQESTYLNDVNYGWVYPGNFDSGTMKIESVAVGGEETQWEFVENKDLPQNVVAEVILQKLLEPGETVNLKIIYSVKIPEKFGPFGHYGKDIVLNGGFYPYLPHLSREGRWMPRAYPERSDFGLKIKGKGDFVVNGQEVKPDEQGEFNAHINGTDYISLFNSRNIYSEQLSGRKIKLNILFHTRERTILKNLRLDARRFLDFVGKQPEFESFNGEITLCEAYLRDRLIQPSDGVLYFSDRIYKLFPSLRGYHSLELIRGLFYELLRPKIREKENPESYDWVTAVLSWHYLDRLVSDQYSAMKRDARDIRLVRLFSFLPQMDQVIYAPQFSFTGAYYNLVYSSDPFRLDILDYNNNVLSKRVVYEKIKDKFYSDFDLKKFYLGYYEGNNPFRKSAQDFFGKDVDLIFSNWLGSYPQINYFLKSIKRKKLPQGGYDNRVVIGKKSDDGRPVAEPVNLHLEEWNGERHVLKWDGTGDEKIFEIQTKDRLRTVHIDPSGKLWETRLGDNRSPALYKLILTDYGFGLDISSISPEFNFSMQFRRLYGSRNRYNISAYTGSASYGASVGYQRLFGRFLDSLRFSHGIAFYYNLDNLNSDYIVSRPGIDDPSSILEVTVNPKGLATSLYLYYYFGSQISYTNPKQGMGATFYAGFGSKYLGGNFNFYKSGLTCSGVVPFNQNNMLALKLEFGFSGNDGIPPQQQFFLGGMNDMKGFPQGEISRVGRNKLLISAEYRHYLLKDIDINLGSIFRVRNVMGALFTDTGRVTGTVEKYADHLANGTGFSPNPVSLFDIKHYDADIGYGIKFLYDALGVRESVLSFDVAKSLTNFKNYGVRYYIYFNQSF